MPSGGGRKFANMPRSFVVRAQPLRRRKHAVTLTVGARPTLTNGPTISALTAELAAAKQTIDDMTRQRSQEVQQQ
eukprot:2268146-Pleurochrysis_carterae.AAC.1